MARMIMNTDNFQPMPQEPAAQAMPVQQPTMQQPAQPVEHRRSRSGQSAPMAAPQPMQQPAMYQQPVQQPVPQPVRQAAPQPVVQQPVVQQPDPEEARYAHMFASWDLLPPQVLIRRVTRK